MALFKITFENEVWYVDGNIMETAVGKWRQVVMEDEGEPSLCPDLCELVTAEEVIREVE